MRLYNTHTHTHTHTHTQVVYVYGGFDGMEYLNDLYALGLGFRIWGLVLGFVALFQCNNTHTHQ